MFNNNGIREYKKIVSKAVIEKLYRKAETISDMHIVAISSTYVGGGVAEMLNSMIPLFDDIGVKLGWRILHGSPDFFRITKGLHNALQGGNINLTERKKRIYYETNKRFSKFTHIEDHDFVIVHDPQPLPLIDFYNKKQPWIFRCHIDISDPSIESWEFIKPFIEKYDNIVVSLDKYAANISKPVTVIHPAIDPLSFKNKELGERTINRCLDRLGIDNNKPMLLQVSRFDKWKDPVGVIKIFEMVRERTNCQLVLAGGMATDDPQGETIFRMVESAAKKSKYANDIHIILNSTDTQINCLQRTASVVIQNSIREGFGLVISEALFKETPVVASNVGGIPLQVLDGINGFLHEPGHVRAFANSILTLLENDRLREEMGKRGRNHVINNFLITRKMIDWLNLIENVSAKNN